MSVDAITANPIAASAITASPIQGKAVNASSGGSSLPAVDSRWEFDGAGIANWGADAVGSRNITSSNLTGVTDQQTPVTDGDSVKVIRSNTAGRFITENTSGEVIPAEGWTFIHAWREEELAFQECGVFQISNSGANYFVVYKVAGTMIIRGYKGGVMTNVNLSLTWVKGRNYILTVRINPDGSFYGRVVSDADEDVSGVSAAAKFTLPHTQTNGLRMYTAVGGPDAAYGRVYMDSTVMAYRALTDEEVDAIINDMRTRGGW